MGTTGRPSDTRHLRCYLLLLVSCAVLCRDCEAFGIGREGPRIRSESLPAGSESVESCGPETSKSTDRRAIIDGLVTTITTAFVVTTYSQTSVALSPEDASSAYDTYAPSYDELDGGAASSLLGLDEARSQLLVNARGRVLEIGVGTGLNLAKYNPSAVTFLTVADISEGMLREAKEREKSLNLPFPVDFVTADATSQLVDLFGENAFDTVVDSFSLCVMGNGGAKQCLSQMTQVVKKQSDGGRVLLLENSRSSNPIFGKYQDITADAAASAGGKGCVYNQDVGALIKDANGLEIESETSHVAGLFRSYVCVKSM